MDKTSFETTERRLENLVFHRFDVQNKYVYYILAIDATCIGFTVNFTKGVLLSYKDLPLGLSVLLWLISFCYGIFQIQNHEMAMQLNIKELSAYVKQEKVSEDLQIQQKNLSFKGSKFRKYQNGTLLLGVICFIIWRLYNCF
jgi:hypothetical protein